MGPGLRSFARRASGLQMTRRDRYAIQGHAQAEALEVSPPVATASLFLTAALFLFLAIPVLTILWFVGTLIVALL